MEPWSAFWIGLSLAIIVFNCAECWRDVMVAKHKKGKK